MDEVIRGQPEVFGIPNYGYISGPNPKIYRGGQPKTKAAFEDLARMGVKAVINLRFEDDAVPGEAAEVAKNGMDYVIVGMSPITVPTKEKMDTILAVIEAAPGPVFIHCQYGCERTGIVCAAWRIRKYGWTGEQALKEADFYGMAEFYEKLRQFILDFK